MRRWPAKIALLMLGSVLLTACGSLLVARGTHASAAAVRSAMEPTGHYEYVFVDDAMYIYDIDHAQQLVRRQELPGITGIRGVGADLVNHRLYISHGGDGDGNGTGGLAALDLVTDQVVWDHPYDWGIDSFAIGRDGRTIYMPDGELSHDGTWHVLDTGSGRVIGNIRGGIGPHNTIVGLSGRYVYLGGRNAQYLYVVSTASDKVSRRVGPLRTGVRPFTVNGRESLAYTTATGALGFQVSSLRSGRVLYTTGFGQRFHYNPSAFAPSAPSHGIALSPDERRLWVIDGPNSYIHVFDVSTVPSHRPRQVADIKLPDAFEGRQANCSYDCARDGWLQLSRSGCFVYVGDSGDVLSAKTLRVVGFMPALRNSREYLEIDWSHGVPSATTTRAGLGYVTGAHRPPPPTCR